MPGYPGAEEWLSCANKTLDMDHDAVVQVTKLAISGSEVVCTVLISCDIKLWFHGHLLNFEDGKNPAIVPLMVCVGSITGWWTKLSWCATEVNLKGMINCKLLVLYMFSLLFGFFGCRSKYYRQTLIFSSFVSPEMNSLFNRHCFNILLQFLWLFICLFIYSKICNQTSET